jgi:hypothetical protein
VVKNQTRRQKSLETFSCQPKKKQNCNIIIIIILMRRRRRRRRGRTKNGENG